MHHRHSELVALHAEPNGNNPAKHIGYVCPGCLSLFTAKHRPSEAVVPTSPKVPNSPPRRSKSHAGRVRAAERLGYVLRLESA